MTPNEARGSTQERGPFCSCLEEPELDQLALWSSSFNLPLGELSLRFTLGDFVLFLLSFPTFSLSGSVGA